MWHVSENHGRPRQGAGALIDQLNTVEEIRGDLNEQGIDLPGVVVCGDQSAGKSSVLESLTGIEFPRSESTCTRCPAIVRVQANATCQEPYALVGTDAKLDNATKVKLDEIGDQITQLTDWLCKDEQSDSPRLISKAPIHIKVVKPSGPTFTLIDLPGITHNLPDGYHKDDCEIYQLTSGLVEDYIKKPEMVVLVVMPADSDFQNAAALNLAKKWDPEGDRTLGVVTKVDKVIDAHDTIVSRIHMDGPGAMKLKLGFVAVRNRTPGEIEANTSHEVIKQQEKNLFETHPLLSKISKDCVGFDVLSARIVDLQAKRLKESIPETLRHMTQEVATLERLLAQMPPSSSSYEDCVRILNGILHEIAKALEYLTVGERQGGQLFQGDDVLKYSICPRAREIMDGIATSLREAMPDYLGKDMTTTLKQELQESRGSGLSNLIGGPAVHGIARRYLEKALQPNCSNLTEQLTDLLRQVALPLVNKTAVNYPHLRQELSSIVAEHLEQCKTKADEFLATLALANVRHVDTLNHYYSDTINKVREVKILLAREENPQISGIDDTLWEFVIGGKDQSNEAQTIADHQVSLYAYNKVVLKSFIDIMWHASHELLLYRFHDQLVPTVSVQLTGAEKAEVLVALMAEDRSIARERERIMKRLACFRRNIPRLKEIRFA